MMNIDFRNHIEFNEDDIFTTRVRLFTGYKCNYVCGFCFYKNCNQGPFDEGIRRQATIARLNEIDSLDISGGEPTIIHNWFETLELFKQQGFENLAVITNGSTFHNLDFLKKSMDFGLNEVLFSYHGHSEESHDKMTGKKGSYKKLILGIENAKKLGLIIRINTVITSRNYKDLPKLAVNMKDIEPECFNFLPFRLENNATMDNMVKTSESVKYIKQAIDILEEVNPFISVRYIPFCLMKGYEKYVCGWLQKLFDPYEWSQHTFECLENIRLETDTPSKCIMLNKSRKDLEFEATYGAIRMTSGYITSCMRCSLKWMCEGIWKSYSMIYGTKEFAPIQGEDICDIMHYRRNYTQSFFN